VNLGDPGSWNRFAYTGGDPVNYVDPKGLARCEVHSLVTLGDPLVSPFKAEVWCISDGQTLEATYHDVPSFSGSWSGIAAEMAMTMGVLLDELEWARSEGALRATASAIATMEFSQDCVNSINSVMHGLPGGNSDNATVVELRAAARNVRFRNGFTTTGSLRISPTSTTYALSPIPGTTISWRPGAETGRPAGWLGGAVIHELLHNMGFDDDEMHIGLRLDKQPGYDGDVTDDISIRFGVDCFGMRQ
jgi:hypothetical protein